MSKMRVWLAALVVLVLAVAAISGCTPESDGGEATRPPTDEEARANEVVMAGVWESDVGWDPVQGWSAYGHPVFQSTLLTRDVNLYIENDLATGYEISDDGITWTVTVRDDVVFHDGEPLTAKDVAFTFEKAKDSGSVVDLTILASAVATDDEIVVFTLNEPRSTFLYQLATIGIVPEHAYDDDYGMNPIGSGPFKFVQWDQGQQLIVEANDDYYGGRPKIDKVTFLFMEEDARFAAAKAGDIDVVAVPATLATQDIAGMDLVAVESIDNRGLMFPFLPDEGDTTEAGHPIGNDVTSDLAIRQAINYAIDRQALVDGVLSGFGSPAYTVSDGMAWWNPDTVIEDGDIERAKQILADGGWTDENGNGIVQKNGLEAKFAVIYPAGEQTRQSLAMVASDQLKEIGIEMTPEGKSWDEIETLMHSNAVLFGWGSYDPLEMYNLYSTSYAGQGWWNTGFYSNPTVDEYMDDALRATDEDEANELWKKAQWDGTTGFSAKGDAAWSWLVNLDHCYFVREGLNTGEHRVEAHGHGWIFAADLKDWHWE